MTPGRGGLACVLALALSACGHIGLDPLAPDAEPVDSGAFLDLGGLASADLGARDLGDAPDLGAADLGIARDFGPLDLGPPADLGPAMPCVGDGTACGSAPTDGVCHVGNCCLGCFDEVVCRTGRDDRACGRVGERCVDCVPAVASGVGTCDFGVCEFVCDPGYVSNGVACIDVDECASGMPCGANSLCTNTTGSFTCACLPGFAGTSGRSCVDVDECLSPTRCGRNLAVRNTCTNTAGGYTCTCGFGFRLSGVGLSATCEDVDECASGAQCGVAGTCTNLPGTYSCVCGAGRLNCRGEPDCETDRGTVSNCNSCGDVCSGATPLCCIGAMSAMCRASCA